MGGYEVLTGGGSEATAESKGKAQGHNGTSLTCTCETCTEHRERTHIYGPTPKPPVELEPTFTFKGASKLQPDARADLLYLVKVGARRYSPNSFPMIWDFTDQLIRQIDGPACDIDQRRYQDRDRKHILKWLHEIHGKDTTAHGAEVLLDLINEYERFVFPEGYKPDYYPSVQTLKQEQWDREHGTELR